MCWRPWARSRGGSAARARDPKAALLREVFPLTFGDGGLAYLTLLGVEYREGQADTYVLSVGFAAGERATVIEQMPQAVIARVQGPEPGVLFDALSDQEF